MQFLKIFNSVSPLLRFGLSNIKQYCLIRSWRFMSSISPSVFVFFLWLSKGLILASFLIRFLWLSEYQSNWQDFLFANFISQPLSALLLKQSSSLFWLRFDQACQEAVAQEFLILVSYLVNCKNPEELLWTIYFFQSAFSLTNNLHRFSDPSSKKSKGNIFSLTVFSITNCKTEEQRKEFSETYRDQILGWLCIWLFGKRFLNFETLLTNSLSLWYRPARINI